MIFGMNAFTAAAPLPVDSRNGLISARSAALSGDVGVPGDKSISHRSLMFAALAPGRTAIEGLLEGEDVLRTARAVIGMGAAVAPPDRSGGVWTVTGPEALRNPRTTLDLGNSGTSARLLMGLIGGFGVQATLTGDASLQRRPMGRVIKPLAQMGVRFEASAGDRLPLRVIGQPQLRAIDYVLPVASAQVKSAILLAGLRAGGVTAVHEPEPTRDHTERMLRAFGVDVARDVQPDGSVIAALAGGQPLVTPGRIVVPGDPSSAAFLAVAALIVPGSDITVRGVLMNPLRTGLYDTLLEMGGDIRIENRRDAGGEEVADLRVRTSALKGVDVPESRVASMIDEFPILGVAASFAQGETRMTCLAELRVKESDRLAAIAAGLSACGVDVTAGESDLTVRGTGKPPAGGATIATRLDHRIGMSFLVMGLASDAPVAIDAAETIGTSFPGFADLMNSLGARITAPV
jgi:3-phosphoshikimate 1-carboxyvinyltransferase